MTADIHPTAIIEPGATVGPGCEIQAYAIVKRGALLGEGVQVHPFAVVGGDSQDLKFDRAVASGVRIGAGTRIRESVTIHRATHAGGRTEVGASCLLMAGCHVAHDCVVGHQVVIANAVLLAGHVTVGDHAILGGGSVYHQFIRIGEGVMISGGSRFTRDIAPFTLAAERDEIVGLNLIGLRRRGVPPESIRQLKEAFRAVYFTAGNIREVAAAARASGAFPAPEPTRFLEFFAGGKRGFVRARRKPLEDGDEA
jgi:UDP-N-acetylglucosamine acyltransferase